MPMILRIAISSFHFVVVSSFLLTGCGQGVDPGRGVPVSGVVTMDGKPLEGASVTFMKDTFAGYGKTDAEGKYRLVQGAVPGNNKITISKLPPGAELVADDPESGMDAGMKEAEAMGAAGGTGMPEVAKDLVPEDYSNPNKSKLMFEVPAGGTTSADFNL